MARDCHSRKPATTEVHARQMQTSINRDQISVTTASSMVNSLVIARCQEDYGFVLGQSECLTRLSSFCVRTHASGAEQQVGDIPIVEEFFNVFSQELSHLPPFRDIDFSIEPMS
ncbi:hypothetical protein Nepgr_018949 [Nepenthes gracilis]|uniref:DDT domain-containing protein n=1 Tax=Nepenthes gracilis TaxID=150966 RepID=A0AAD3ST37_NEPGR|nr:hypothetical protein Nepgr_018949 [Nepenthes gracilis]